jgi:hypothetical protein
MWVGNIVPQAHHAEESGELGRHGLDKPILRYQCDRYAKRLSYIFLCGTGNIVPQAHHCLGE